MCLGGRCWTRSPNPFLPPQLFPFVPFLVLPLAEAKRASLAHPSPHFHNPSLSFLQQCCMQRTELHQQIQTGVPLSKPPPGCNFLVLVAVARLGFLLLLPSFLKPFRAPTTSKLHSVAQNFVNGQQEPPPHPSFPAPINTHTHTCKPARPG